MAQLDTGSLRRYRRAADYVAAAQIYLRDNALLREPLQPEHLKPQLLGHWGTCPGITFVYAGLDRLIADTGAEVLLVTGPGHGAAANHANLWLEGAHAEADRALSRDLRGLTELVRRFSWPDGFAGNLTPDLPGVVHPGGEVGYALATAFGAAFDAPDRVVACLVGDGEAETGATAAAWQSTKFLDPVTSGAVLPVLHLNGYKIGSPTVFASMDDTELEAYFRGTGWSPRIVDATTGDDPDAALGEALDDAYRDLRAVQADARDGRRRPRPAWPMLVVRTPKGWGTVQGSGGRPTAGTFHSHHLPVEDPAGDPEQLRELERWLRSYRPDELFDEEGRPADDVLSVCPEGDRRMGCTPSANGGLLRRELPLPALEPYAPPVGSPGAAEASAVEVLARWLAQLLRDTEHERDVRVVCPDELTSNRLGPVLEATDRAFCWPVEEYAEHLSPDGRVLEVLSEHLCQGWLAGYLLTGRHGLFASYEAFVEVVSSMLNQHAKFLAELRGVPWRAPVSSLTYLLTSQGWRQQSNGFTHQSPGFLNQVLEQDPEVAHVYLPPDVTTLLVTMERCLGSTNGVNAVVAGKAEAPVWLDLPAARAHCQAGVGEWPWASTCGDAEPDVVLACAGDVPTVEALAAAQQLRHDAPWLRLRVVNAVDLTALVAPGRHPHALSPEAFGSLFGADTPVVMAFHGYPSAVHALLAGRPSPQRFSVHGFLERGGTTTAYDLLLLNGASRRHLAIDVLVRAGREDGAAELIGRYEDDIAQAREHIRREGVDPQEVTQWQWAS